MLWAHLIGRHLIGLHLIGMRRRICAVGAVFEKSNLYSRQMRRLAFSFSCILFLLGVSSRGVWTRGVFVEAVMETLCSDLQGCLVLHASAMARVWKMASHAIKKA